MKMEQIKYRPTDFEQVFSLGAILHRAMHEDAFAQKCETNLSFMLASCAFVNDINDADELIMPADWPRMAQIVTAWLKLHALIEGSDDESLQGIIAIEIPTR